jgi:hypothetical protein
MVTYRNLDIFSDKCRKYGLQFKGDTSSFDRV